MEARPSKGAAAWADCLGLRSFLGLDVAPDIERGTELCQEPFDICTVELSELTVPGSAAHNLQALEALGCGAGVCERLLTSPQQGITGTPSDVSSRRHAFGENRFPEQAFESWVALFLGCFKEPILIILLVASGVSLIVNTLGDPATGYIDGLAILIAVVIVAGVTATNDYRKAAQFRALFGEGRAREEVRVRRAGDVAVIRVLELVVGDIVFLEAGAVIPADGVLLRSSDLRVNESALTGESEDVPKHEGDAPILLSGSEVANGTGLYVVTAVGPRSMQGAIVQDTLAADGETPLQAKLDALAKRIGYVGTAAALGTLVALMALKAAGSPAAASQGWGPWTINAFIFCVTIIVVAIPEGLPLAVTISLAYSTRKMLADNNLIRHLAACETMGGVTDICSDKTGTLTENRMAVVRAWLAGADVAFAPDDGSAASPPQDDPARSPNLRVVPAGLRSLLRDHLSINSTAVVVASDKGVREVKGSKTEGAGLLLVQSFGYRPLELREAAMADPSTPDAGASRSTPVRRRTDLSPPGRSPTRSNNHAPPPASPLLSFLSRRPQRTVLPLSECGATAGSGVARAAAASPPHFSPIGVKNGHSPRRLQHAEAASRVRVLKQLAFSSERKMMSSVVELFPGGPVRVYTTGGADYVLALCSHVMRGGDSPASPGGAASPPVRSRRNSCTSYDLAGLSRAPLSPAEGDALVSSVIVAMASDMLRTLGLAFREFRGVGDLPAGWESAETATPLLEGGLTLYAIVGIRDPLRKDVKESVAQVQRAGVKVRMVTGDNKVTAAAVARECGILSVVAPPSADSSSAAPVPPPRDLVLEGPLFRALTPAQLDEVLPLLAVLARCSPRDKNIFVRRLNGNLPRTAAEWAMDHPGCDWVTQRDLLLPGYYEEWAAARRHPSGVVYKPVVGVTGDGTNDAPALKASDVGLSMGLSGTQVAMQASDIIILDDRFSSIVRAVVWGRAVYDDVQKFLQFQLTVNVVALALTFFAAVLQYEPPLNPVEMLWLNLIMDTMGALALGTEPPSDALLARLPYSSTAGLISPRMWRHIFVQAAFQFAMLITLLLAGPGLLGVDDEFLVRVGKSSTLSGPNSYGGSTDIARYMSTFIFNAFVFSQIFNEWNARSLTDAWNVYTRLNGSGPFLTIILIEAGLQAVLVELGGPFLQTTGLTATHWGISILLGALSAPLGVVMRAIPVPSRPADTARFYEDHFAIAMAARRQANGTEDSLARRLEDADAEDLHGGGGVGGGMRAADPALQPSPGQPPVISLPPAETTPPPQQQQQSAGPVVEAACESQPRGPDGPPQRLSILTPQSSMEPTVSRQRAAGAPVRGPDARPPSASAAAVPARVGESGATGVDDDEGDDDDVVTAQAPARAPAPLVHLPPPLAVGALHSTAPSTARLIQGRSFAALTTGRPTPRGGLGVSGGATGTAAPSDEPLLGRPASPSNSLACLAGLHTGYSPRRSGGAGAQLPHKQLGGGVSGSGTPLPVPAAKAAQQHGPSTARLPVSQQQKPGASSGSAEDGPLALLLGGSDASGGGGGSSLSSYDPGLAALSAITVSHP